MRSKSVVALVLALASIVGLPTAVAAQSDDPVADRIAIMRSNGMLLRSAMRATGDEAITAAQTLSDNYGALPALFEDPAQPGDALPAVWENFEAFVAIFETGETAALAALAAAEAGDQAGYTQNIQTVAGTCNTCHGQFRK